MRNLKRALSLALASVMVLGLMVVGSGASYSDVTSEENQEAIEVLQKVGVMVGDQNGNFNPDQLVTRNEMAVIMSNLMDYRVASYKGTSPFADVPEWAEPYVAACWTNGIIAGYSDTYYGGSDTVTTAQAALILMKALGYFQYQSDFKDDWQLATVSQANKIELFDDVESNVIEAMSRNDVAQLVLNTLASGMVEADDDITSVTAPGVSVTTGKVNYIYVTSQKSYARAIDNLQAVSATGISTQGYIVELGEKLYDGDLKRTENTSDPFGRPSTKWEWKTEEIGTYTDDPIGVYTAKVTKGALWSLIGKNNYDDLGGSATLNVYTNGQDVTTNKSDYFVSNSTGAANNTGKGMLTEVYMDDDGNVQIATVITYLAQANGDFKANAGTLNTITLTAPTGFTVGTLDEDDFDNLDTFQDEDYILYTVSTSDGTNYTVEDIAKAEIVTGEVNNYAAADDGYVTIDGTKYSYAKHAESDTNNGWGVTYNVGENAAIVLDAYGYVLYVDDAALSVGNYLYVDGIVKATGFDDDYQVQAYFSDGTKAKLTIDKMYANRTDTTKIDLKTTYPNIGNDTNAADAHRLDGFYSYTESDGEYTLRKASNTSTGPIAFTGGDVITGESVRFLTGYTVRGDADTVFVVYDDDEDITVYTGINAAPDIVAGANGVQVSYMLEKDDASKNASFVWINASTDGNSIDGSSNEEVLFVLNKDSSYVNKANGDTIDRFNVVLNGEKTQVDAKQGDLSIYTMYYKYKVDSDGYYDGNVFTDGVKDTHGRKTLAESSYDQIDFSNGVLTLGGYAYNVDNDTEIVLILTDVGTTLPVPANNKANDAEMKIIMTDPDAKNEVQVGLTGKALANTVKGYYVSGVFYGILADKDKDYLETLYVHITAATVAP